MWEEKHFQKCDCCTFVFIQAVSGTNGTTSEAYYIYTTENIYVTTDP
jgi:hypothetical protein